MALSILCMAVACVTVFGVGAEEAFSESCDSSLLQLRQGRGWSGGVQAVPAPQARGWLGWGRWTDRENFWNMKMKGGESFFTQDLPDSCFTEAQCEAVQSSVFTFFASVESWSQYYGVNFGVGGRGSYDGFTASIDASIGSGTTALAAAQRKLSYSARTFQRKCYRLILSESCAYNQSTWKKMFSQRLSQMPKDGPYDEGKMEMWKKEFIQRFGTHIPIKSSHGSKIHALSSIDSRTKSAKDCSSYSLCSRFGFDKTAIESVAGNFCQKSSSCMTSGMFRESMTAQCVAVGGEPTLQGRLCDADTSAEDVAAWSTGGSLDSDSSAIGYDLLPISTFLLNTDLKYQAAADALEKAVEYANCLVGQQPPVQEWIDEKCQCVRKCENGGKINPLSCTCECRGDIFHGWAGASCTETYGKCQAGAGSNNNGWTYHCPMANLCSSSFSQESCRNTDVCCTTHWGSWCCPFGSTCDCGSFSCSCVASNSTA